MNAMKRMLFAGLALMLPLAAVAEPLKPLQKICAQLRSDGWTAPTDLLTGRPGTAEMSISGAIYMCTLSRELKPAGSGHAPDLQALLSSAGEGPSVILSGDVWCAADRAATFDALAKQLERVVGSLPEPIAAAIRAGREAKATANGLSYEVTPIEVEPQACASVPPGKLGPVLIKIDVEVKAAK
jgi:hypothetical protein